VWPWKSDKHHQREREADHTYLAGKHHQRGKRKGGRSYILGWQTPPKSEEKGRQIIHTWLANTTKEWREREADHTYLAGKHHQRVKRKGGRSYILGWQTPPNATFNNISAISWQSVSWWRKLVYPEKTTDHIMFIEYTLPWTGFELTTLVVIGTDCTGSCKSNYHMITT
jgi:hypothetical protein